VPHAAADWKRVTARTEAALGTAERRPGRVVVSVQPARRLSGSVRDARTKQALAGVVVSVYDRRFATSASGFTHAAGRHSLFPVPGGRYSLSAIRRGYGWDRTEGEAERLDLRKSLASVHDFDLDPLRRVAGRVLDESGEPVADASVSLGWEGMGTLYTDSNSK